LKFEIFFTSQLESQPLNMEMTKFKDLGFTITKDIILK